jgi:hypothetical protein
MNVGENMAAQSILMYKFKLLQIKPIDTIVSKIEEYFQQDEKFIIDFYNQNQVEGAYIYLNNYRENVFDYDTNTFKLVNVSSTIVTKFNIDLLNSILYIWGSKKTALRITAAFSLIFQNKIILEPNDIIFKKCLKFLEEEKNIIVCNTKIDDIIFETDLVATCTINLALYSNPFEILNKYIDKISKVTVILGPDSDNVSISIYQSGSIVIYKNREQLSEKASAFVKDLLIASRRE